MSKDRIGLLTYQGRHIKTFDVLCLLKANGFNQVSVFAAPLHYKKTFQPLYEHRPETNSRIPDTSVVCRNFGYDYYEGNLEEIVPIDVRVILICGAGIISDKFVSQHTVVNSHPGYLPICRGLDAVKWAIYEDKPIGVTTHVLGKEVDGGEIIERKLIPIYFNDTFHSVARRVYDEEIRMLVESLRRLNQKYEHADVSDFILHKRMPHNIEKDLLNSFEAYKNKYGRERDYPGVNDGVH